MYFMVQSGAHIKKSESTTELAGKGQKKGCRIERNSKLATSDDNILYQLVVKPFLTNGES